MEHPALAQVVQYVAGTLTEEDAFHIEAHLGRCSDCATRVRAHRLLRDHRRSIFATRPRRSLAESQLKERLRAFVAETDVPEDLRSRLLRWSRDLFVSTRAALRVGLESATRRAWIRIEETARLPHGRSLLTFEPVLQPVRVRGKEQYAPVVVESPTAAPVRVVADAVEGTVLVRHPKGDPPYPLVLLIGASSGYLRPAELSPVRGEPYLLARFEDVPDGEYTLLLQGP